ncbi:MAG: ABC transporter permease subunit, partial [Candidatus Aminicenantales bacterium]
MRLFKDRLARRTMLVLTSVPAFLVLLILVGLFIRSRPILAEKPFFSLLMSSSWSPLRGDFGLLPFLMGTLWVTFIALALAVPVSLLTAVYLSEYAPRFVREFTKPIIDLLAGLPSVIYGVWGVLLVVPLVGRVIAPVFGVQSSGYSVLAGGIVLAIMIFPTIIAVSLEVFSSIPDEMREASLSL